jgi:7-carboxy-7-deazaguanine synthase
MSNSDTLIVNEIFYSLQGEGSDVGMPAIFIRLTGCNLRCSYCDTTYAFFEGKEISVDDIIGTLKTWPCTRVCVTGGEPLLQENLPHLIDRLVNMGYAVGVETNGSVDVTTLTRRSVTVKMDVKLPSSGEEEAMLPENIDRLRPCDDLKFVIGNRRDYDRACRICADTTPRAQIVMQPVWGTEIPLADWIVADRLQVRYVPQLHKILWGDRRGV